MKVGIVKTKSYYPTTPPFHPDTVYPEYPFSDKNISKTKNPVYEAVRKSLFLIGLDKQNYDTAAWNPFRDLVKPGSRVIIKPNFVNHYNPVSDERAYFEALVTQAAVIRPVIDYVMLAAKSEISLIITDLPIQLADFEIISRKTGLDQVIEFVQDKMEGKGSIELADLRDYRLKIDSSGAILSREEQPGDPKGYVIVDMGENSNLVPLDKDAHLYRSPDYDSSVTVKAHTNGHHQYCFPKSVLNSDLFINIPKIKVHRKSGITGCLKNIVGVAGDKQYLPHWRAGTPETNGDEQPIATVINSLRGRYSFAMRSLGTVGWRLVHPIGRLMVRFNKKIHKSQSLVNILSGDWYGNDTVWRMVHDLNCILLYADSDGLLHEKPQRKFLNIIDGIIAGECEGPLRPQPVPAGLIVTGFDPVSVDVCCAQLMDLDWRKIPQYAKYNVHQKYAFSSFNGDPQQIEVIQSENGLTSNGSLNQILPTHHFEPTEGWKGHIEL
jgi:uncharacterized protein (DUF362 family)